MTTCDNVIPDHQGGGAAVESWPSAFRGEKSSASVKREPELGLASSPPRTPVPKEMPPKGEAGGGVPKGEAGGGVKAGARGGAPGERGAAVVEAAGVAGASASAKSLAAMNSATSSPSSSRLSRASRRATWAAPSSKGWSFSASVKKKRWERLRGERSG